MINTLRGIKKNMTSTYDARGRRVGATVVEILPNLVTQIKSIDLLEYIKESLGRRLRLDAVAQATVGAKKSADGLQAVRWYREGKIKEIKKYCEQDVKVTKKVFYYALEHGHILFKDGYRKRELPIDTSSWTKKEDSSMTHSLPF